MKNQLRLAIAILVGVSIASAASISEAGRPYSRRTSRSYQPASNSASTHNAQRAAGTTSTVANARGIMQSPERMTKVYGPSILIRSEAETTVAVSQP